MGAAFPSSGTGTGVEAGGALGPARGVVALGAGLGNGAVAHTRSGFLFGRRHAAGFFGSRLGRRLLLAVGAGAYFLVAGQQLGGGGYGGGGVAAGVALGGVVVGKLAVVFVTVGVN